MPGDLALHEDLFIPITFSFSFGIWDLNIA